MELEFDMGMDERLIRDWFESIKDGLPAGAEIVSFRTDSRGRTWIRYEYGSERNVSRYMSGKKTGQVEVTKENITQIDRRNKLRDLGL